MTETHVPDLGAVAAFYDNVAALDILFGQDIHLGYWPDGDGNLSLTEAQAKLTDLVAASIGARDGIHILDVGCGTGGPARRLARTTAATITGITISPKQVEAAEERARQEGLDRKTDFHLADVTALPFPDATFDAAFAIESVIHLPDKHKALEEILRVLRPQARIAIADLTQSQRTPLEGTGAVASLLDLLTPLELGGYRQLLRQTGFVVDNLVDLREQTRLSYTRWQDRLAARWQEVTATAGTEQTTALQEILHVFIEASKTEKLGYTLAVAHKP